MSIDLMEQIKNVTNEPKLLMQADFYADALAEFMPFQPEIWTGGSESKTAQTKHLRLIWTKKKLRNEDSKSITLFLSNGSIGFFDVDGNKMTLNWIATEQAAREAFESAFRYIFGDK